ncbi:unnamed protein product [Trichogramma brassicae]|uniref:nitric-oxide synthase (NADPH) n=1 Tax=Trichogramma brassicae TaxID=86971 RepID=A0A6H5IKZ8_9HYME|nr:unnamed protein product [Trichogramma brassicae]
MADYDITKIEHEALLLVITSTFGNGDPPENGESTSCSGINLGGCPFDSWCEQDRPEERVALPKSHDPQVIGLPLQAPACSSNERNTLAVSSNEFVVLCRRDLPRRACSALASMVSGDTNLIGRVNMAAARAIDATMMSARVLARRGTHVLIPAI